MNAILLCYTKGSEAAIKHIQHIFCKTFEADNFIRIF